MSEEGLSGLDRWISTSLLLLTKVFSSSREKSCCFAHILLDHVASSDTDNHVFPFSLLVHGFHHPGHCQLFVTTINMTPTALSLPYLFWLPQTGGLAVGCSLCSFALENLICFCFVFCHFTLDILHIYFSTPDPHPSIKQPVWDTLPILPSTSQIMILPALLFQVPAHQTLKHCTSTLPLQVHYHLLMNILLISPDVLPSPQQKTWLAQSLSIQITITLPSHCQHCVTYFYFLQSIANILACWLTVFHLSESLFLLPLSYNKSENLNIEV